MKMLVNVPDSIEWLKTSDELKSMHQELINIEANIAVQSLHKIMHYTLIYLPYPIFCGTILL